MPRRRYVFGYIDFSALFNRRKGGPYGWTPRQVLEAENWSPLWWAERNMDAFEQLTGERLPHQIGDSSQGEPGYVQPYWQSLVTKAAYDYLYFPGEHWVRRFIVDRTPEEETEEVS